MATNFREFTKNRGLVHSGASISALTMFRGHQRWLRAFAIGLTT